MVTKPELILDIGGVLATNFSHLFWQELSLISCIPCKDLMEFKKNIRDELWTGKITEKDFWNRVN
jgi:putative hydrolase of the HAD superfamily